MTRNPTTRSPGKIEAGGGASGTERRTPLGSHLLLPVEEILFPGDRIPVWRITGAQQQGGETSPFGAGVAFATFLLFRNGTGRGVVEVGGGLRGGQQVWFIDEWSIREGSAGRSTFFLERGERHLPDAWVTRGFRRFDLGIPATPGIFPARGDAGLETFHARVTRVSSGN
jgi:hypothetical protein